MELLGHNLGEQANQKTKREGQRWQHCFLLFPRRNLLSLSGGRLDKMNKPRATQQSHRMEPSMGSQVVYKAFREKKVSNTSTRLRIFTLVASTLKATCMRGNTEEKAATEPSHHPSSSSQPSHLPFFCRLTHIYSYLRTQRRAPFSRAVENPKCRIKTGR